MTGNSLIEILISLLLASLLLTTEIQLYSICQQHYLKAQKTFERGLERQRVIALMRDSIRRAGFTPCLNLDNLQTLDHRSSMPIEAMVVTDKTLKISRMSEEFFLAKRLNSKQVLLPKRKIWPRQVPLLIADCYHAEVNTVNSIAASNEGLILNLSYPLFADNEDVLYLGEWIEERFFIAKNKKERDVLYYQTRHKEQLSQEIEALSLTSAQPLIRVVLQETNHTNIIVETRQRSL